MTTIDDKQSKSNPSPTRISVGKRFKNFYIIDLVDNVNNELIYNVQCICGSIGNISATGILSVISCGCTSIVGKHKIGLTYRNYTFIKFVGDKDGMQVYEIHCDKCNNNSHVHAKYHHRLCPKCPKEVKIDGKYIDIESDAKRIGIHVNAMRQRLLSKSVEDALSMPKTNRGGKKGIHGNCYFQNILDSVPNHLKRLGLFSRKGFIYYWVRRGVDPSVALQMAVDGGRHSQAQAV